MTTLTQLYNNIKTFVLQTFESKVNEDTNLPVEVENLFDYRDNSVFVYPHIVTDFSSWNEEDSYYYSDFTLPNNHEITITLNSNSSIDIACSDLEDNWIYIQSINGGIYYRSSNNEELISIKVMPNHTILKYQIKCMNNVVSYYVYYRDENFQGIDLNSGTPITTIDEGVELIHSTKTYDFNNIQRRIRIYDDISSIDTLTIRKI